MSGFQAQKQLVRDYYRAIDSCSDDALTSTMSEYVASSFQWRGCHPFYMQASVSSVCNEVHLPMRLAFSSLQRRPDIFMAGPSFDAGGNDIWVCSMGHLLGMFDSPWLGIKPTGKLVMIPYVEFHRVNSGKISETIFFCDILKIMAQAGQYPLPPQTGATIINPGPLTHDGLLFDDQCSEASRTSLTLMDTMIDQLLSSDLHSPASELSKCWHQDMLWFGPAGIGATYTTARYEEQHQGPFGEGLTDISYGQHELHFAEGHYACLYGTLKLRPVGGFMGLPGSQTIVEMPCIDLYRRADDKLAENWVFIDLLHYLKMQGLDVLQRLAAAPSRFA
jgi:predicted ester cyclase